MCVYSQDLGQIIKWELLSRLFIHREVIAANGDNKCDSQQHTDVETQCSDVPCLPNVLHCKKKKK